MKIGGLFVSNQLKTLSDYRKGQLKVREKIRLCDLNTD